MRMRIALFCVARWIGCVLAATGQTNALSAAQPIVANIDPKQSAEPVSNYVFGMFIEHIGKTMYGPLWAEMLDDRKFYFPISSKETEAAPRPQGGPPRNVLRRWRPVGPDDVVVMDKDHPFVGDQSPGIALDASIPHGIRQSGLALVRGKQYTGRIWVRGTPGSKVTVELVWEQARVSGRPSP